MARIECGFTCKDCLSFEKCSYDAYKAANLNGKSEQNLISIANRISCKFFKNKEDYEKVRHGKWNRYGYKWECSICRAKVDLDGTPIQNGLNFCPNCGAKMDGKDK